MEMEWLVNYMKKYLIKNMRNTVLCCAFNSKIGSSRNVARKSRGGRKDGHQRESVEKNAHNNKLL